MTVTVNVSFPKQLLEAMDRVAQQEARSRSELLREAARAYIERKQRWERIFALGQAHAKQLGLKLEDVDTLIAEHRRETGRR